MEKPTMTLEELIDLGNKYVIATKNLDAARIEYENARRKFQLAMENEGNRELYYIKQYESALAR